MPEQSFSQKSNSGMRQESFQSYPAVTRHSLSFKAGFIAFDFSWSCKVVDLPCSQKAKPDSHHKPIKKDQLRRRMDLAHLLEPDCVTNERKKTIQTKSQVKKRLSKSGFQAYETAQKKSQGPLAFHCFFV